MLVIVGERVWRVVPLQLEGARRDGPRRVSNDDADWLFPQIATGTAVVISDSSGKSSTRPKYSAPPTIAALTKLRSMPLTCVVSGPVMMLVEVNSMPTATAAARPPLHNLCRSAPRPPLLARRQRSSLRALRGESGPGPAGRRALRSGRRPPPLPRSARVPPAPGHVGRKPPPCRAGSPAWPRRRARHGGAQPAGEAARERIGGLGDAAPPRLRRARRHRQDDAHHRSTRTRPHRPTGRARHAQVLLGHRTTTRGLAGDPGARAGGRGHLGAERGRHR